MTVVGNYACQTVDFISAAKILPSFFISIVPRALKERRDPLFFCEDRRS